MVPTYINVILYVELIYVKNQSQGMKSNPHKKFWTRLGWESLAESWSGSRSQFRVNWEYKNWILFLRNFDFPPIVWNFCQRFCVNWNSKPCATDLVFPTTSTYLQSLTTRIYLQVILHEIFYLPKKWFPHVIVIK